MKTTLTRLALAMLLAAPALAQTPADEHAGHHPTATVIAQAPATDMTAAEIRKIDKTGGKLTLKHEAIKNLDMPGMTMVFLVKDKSVLDTLKVGDKVRFKAIDEAGKYTVTEIQPEK